MGDGLPWDFASSLRRAPPKFNHRPRIEPRAVEASEIVAADHLQQMLCGAAPERRGEVVSLGLRSIVAGSLATCMTGAVVGLL